MNVFENASARLRNAIDVFGDSFKKGNPFCNIIETQVLSKCKEKVDAMLEFRETVSDASGNASALKRIAWKVLRGEKSVICYCRALVRITNSLAKTNELADQFRVCHANAESALKQETEPLSEKQASELVEEMRTSIQRWRNARSAASRLIVSLSADLDNSFSLALVLHARGNKK